jgi:hypothetical protein
LCGYLNERKEEEKKVGGGKKEREEKRTRKEETVDVEGRKDVEFGRKRRGGRSNDGFLSVCRRGSEWYG